MHVQFSGGLETLWDHAQREIEVDLPPHSTIGDLQQLLAKTITGDKSLFLQDGHLRPGILVLVNDTDWELLGEEDYVVEAGDVVHFASTLHGG